MILNISRGYSQALKECLTCQGTDQIRTLKLARTFGLRIIRNGSKKYKWNSNNKENRSLKGKNILKIYMLRQMEIIKGHQRTQTMLTRSLIFVKNLLLLMKNTIRMIMHTISTLITSMTTLMLNRDQVTQRREITWNPVVHRERSRSAASRTSSSLPLQMHPIRGWVQPC